MPGTTVDVGTGTTLTFGTSAYSAELLSIDWGGIERPAINVDHMGVAAAGAGEMANGLMIPGDITSPGEITATVHFNPENEPPVDAVAETITVTFPLAAGDSTPASFACSGFVSAVSIGVPLEEKMTLDLTITLSGNITLTSAT